MNSSVITITPEMQIVLDKWLTDVDNKFSVLYLYILVISRIIEEFSRYKIKLTYKLANSMDIFISPTTIKLLGELKKDLEKFMPEQKGEAV